MTRSRLDNPLVDELGRGTLSSSRMYRLVRRRGAVRERTFEITFSDPGVRGYVFTSG
jgi:Thioredoxin like C-terminal domain